MSDFRPTKSIGQFVGFDDNSRQLQISATDELLSYDQIIGYELVEEESSARGLARAYSLSFFSAKQISSLKVILSLRDAPTPQAVIRLLITPTKSDSMLYQKLYRSGEKILAELRRVCPLAATEPADDYTDELRRLRSLCDDGIITEDEFQAKKVQLLGL